MPGPTTDAPAPEAPATHRQVVQPATDGRGADESPVRIAVVRGAEERQEAAQALAARSPADLAMELHGVSCFYGSFRAVRDVDLRVAKREITALIGPSGCGKTTLLRTLNRMNDLIPSARMEGRSCSTARICTPRGRPGRGPPADRHGLPEAEPVPQVDLRQRRLRAADQRLQGQHGRARRAEPPHGPRSGTRSRTSSSSPAWRCPAASSSGCASPGPSPIDPEVILMDEPCSALDPVATLQIEELMHELKNDVHDRDRDPQHAAGRAGLRPHGVLHDGRGPRRATWSRRATPIDDLHQPAEPADRGLRLRPVRLRGATHDRRTTTDERRRPRQVDADAAGDAGDSRATVRPSRAKLDRERAAEVKDNVLRMGVARREPDPRGHPRRSPPRRRRGPRVIIDDAQINEVQRKRRATDRGDDRHPAAGRARPALPAHPRPRPLRARAHGRPRRVGRQAGAQARAVAPLKDYVRPAAPGRARRGARARHPRGPWSTSTR